MLWSRLSAWMCKISCRQWGEKSSIHVNNQKLKVAHVAFISVWSLHPALRVKATDEHDQEYDTRSF